MIQEDNKLIPSENMHLKNINSGDIYETYIYLGKYDSKDNYVDVSEKEYQEYLKKKAEPVEINEA